MQAIISSLESTPTVLRALLQGVSEEEGGWRPAPNRWSMSEVLGHLAHVESRAFRGRVERILREENPLLEPYEPEEFAAAGAYSGCSVAEGLDAFERERAVSLAFLRTVPASAMTRTGVHGKLGPVEAGHVLNEWAFHDLGHIRQVAELLRAVRFYTHLGPWQNFYTIHP